MVSFSCEACNETMVKKKVQQHIGRCRASVTCIDCSVTFPGTQFKDHNQCITEDQKYQGKLYKPKAKPAAPPAAPTPKQADPSRQPSERQAGERTETSKKTEAKADGATKPIVKVTKRTPLKKLLKGLEKQYKLDKKQLLKSLVVDQEGRLVFA